MKIKKLFPWIVFLPIILSCGLFSYQPVPINSDSYIEGFWVPTEYTLEFMDLEGYEFSEHSIKFFSDGEVIVTNIPSEWLFSNGSITTEYYSGIASWSVQEKTVSNKDDIDPIVYIHNSDGEKLSINFIAVLDVIGFVPVSNPKEVNWVTFQKCYPKLRIYDPVLLPLVIALNESPRDRIGFSPITSEDRIEINGNLGEDDIWFYSYTDFSSHSILFRLIDDEYVWVHEQEIIRGLETWEDHDGARWEENILLQYQTEDINGGPINDLMVDYSGHDPRLTNTSDNWYLSNNIKDVMPVINEWREWRMEQPPSPQSLCP